MTNRFLIIMLTMCSLLGCKGQDITFSDEQKTRIGKDVKGGIMPLFKVDSPSDSLVLRDKSVDFTPEEVKSKYYKVLKARMLATVTDPINEGVGIAAPQVGITKRLVAVQRFDKENEPIEFYLNPYIIWSSEECEVGGEGCLSVPNQNGGVKRAKQIKIKYADDKTMRNIEETVNGFVAVIFQHEIDHLEGILYIDRLEPNVPQEELED